MLRVTPLYGSRWEKSGAARSGSCTLVEYADVRVLVDVGLRNNEDTSFWENLPPHDCLVLTDSTLESMGSLPLYVNGRKRALEKQRKGTNSLPNRSSDPRRRSSSLLRRTSSLGEETEDQRRLSRLIADQLDEESSSGNSNDEIPPIFATFPTVKMGQMTLYDHHANISLDGGRPPYTLEEMDRAIAMLRTIKYSQTLTLPLTPLVLAADNSAVGTKPTPLLSVTAHRAGHVVGGAFYRFERLRDETSVVLTGNAYHIAKELHLDACTLLKNGTGADVLVTRPGGPAFPLVNALYSKKKKNTLLASRARQDLTERILGFLRRDANVLLPVDASGRALELILLLNRFWAKQNLGGSYNLVWFGSMVQNTLEFGRSQLEWMNSQLGNHIFDTSYRKRAGTNDDFGERGKHPYLLKHVTLCTNLSELDKVLAESNDNPTCVLANGLTLDHGPARDLFLRWADNDNNAVIFTDSSQCWERKTNEKMVPDTAAKDETATKAFAQTESSASSASSRIIESAPTIPGVAATEAADATDDHHNASELEDSMMGKPISEGDASPFTVAYQLLKHWAMAQAEDREMDDVVEVDVLVPSRKPLAGIELAAFLEREEASRLARRKKEEEEAMLREVELAKGRLRLGEDTQSGTGATTEASAPTNATSSPSKASHLPFFRKKKSRFDSSLFLKFSKPLHLTFELREDAVGIGQKDLTARFGIGESIEANAGDVLEDDYGISVRPEQFRDIVTGVDPSKFGAQKDEISKRGLGYAASGTNAGSSNGDDANRKKRRRRTDELGLDGDGKGGDENDDDLDERGMEAIDLSEGNGIVRGRNGRPPTKVSTVYRRIEVVAEIDYIPFEGRVDSRAARQSVRALQPRQVVVLGGSNGDDAAIVTDEEDEPPSLLVDEVKALADAAQGSRKQTVRTPSDEETVELQVGHNAYPARLVATPFRTKEERQLEKAVPDPIELVETKIGGCTVSRLDFVMTGQKVALDGSIVIAPKNTDHNKSLSSSKSMFERELERPPVYVSDGEVLLTDLRTELIAQHGMKAEYSARVGYSQLIVNGRVVVKKWSEDHEKAGKIDVEGPLCEDFFTVRSVVCGQYVTL